MCVLCNTVVRSESVWNVHLNAKAHRDNIHLAKQRKVAAEFKAPANVVPSVPSKRPHETADKDPVPAKKIKGILKNAPPKPVISNLPTDFFDLNGGTSHVQNTVSNNVPAAPVQEEIVSESVEMEINDDEEITSFSQNRSETIPEGFFDDPIMDAKARHVEYKDPIEEEWEKFQKEIKEEVTVSSQIIEEDHEEATAERQIEEIDEQLRHWNRVLELERKKEAVKAAERSSMEVDADISSGEEEFDEYLDWRAKKSYR